MSKVTIQQCLVCGQIAAGTNPENLKLVCLKCCPRIKDNENTGFVQMEIDLPIPVVECKYRQTGDCKHEDCD